LESFISLTLEACIARFDRVWLIQKTLTRWTEGL
jgi:hypothetical protein